MHLRRALGAERVILATPTQLAAAPLWAHAVGGESRRRDRTILRLADGTVLDESRIGVVLNRLTGIEAPQLARSDPADAAYARHELWSLALSWLGGLGGRVVNRPTPRALHGPEPGHVPWLVAAARAGLRPRGLRFIADARAAGGERWPAHRPMQDALQGLVPEPTASPPVALGRGPALALEPVRATGERALVVDDVAHGAPDPAAATGALALARATGATLLEVAFARALDGGLVVCTVSALPGLLGPGDAARVADLLAGMAGRGA